MNVDYDKHLFCAPQSRVVFDNILVVVVKSEFRDDILFDGQRLTTWSTYWGYAIGRTSVSHAQHFLQVVSGSAATFAAYIYGHSVLDTSSSGYGYALTFLGRSHISQSLSQTLLHVIVF